MSTETTVAPVSTPETTTDDTSRSGDVAHYIDQRASMNADGVSDLVDNAYLFGDELVAMCGERFVPTKNPYGLKVCPACIDIIGKL